MTVWDKDRTWTTKRKSGFEGSDRGGGGRREGRGGRGVVGRGRGSSGLRVREPQKINEFGRNYSQVSGSPINPSNCSMAGSEIDMIREPMECKFKCDFLNADRIQGELSSIGMDVNDAL